MKIMELVPDYYDAFHCLGGACKYTCCQEWRIDIDKAHYKRLRNMKLPSEKHKALMAALKVRGHEQNPNLYAYVAYGEDRKCGMLGADGLCWLQQLVGEENLPSVCRIFPRSAYMVLEQVLERVIRLECESVIQLLLKERDGIQFSTRPTKEVFWSSRSMDVTGKQSELLLLPRSDLLTGDYGINSSEISRNPLLPFYFQLKTLCIGILQNRDYTFHQRILYLGVVLRTLIKLQGEGRADQAGKVIASEMERGTCETIKATMDKLPESDAISMGWLMNLAGVAPMRGLPAYRRELEEAVRDLEIQWNGETFVASASAYAEGKRRFNAFCVENPRFMENIAVALFQRLCMPFGGVFVGASVTAERDLWKNYRLFCGYLATVQFMLRARFLAGVPDYSDLARLTAIVFRRFPNRPVAVKKFEEEMTPGVDADPLEIISILIK